MSTVFEVPALGRNRWRFVGLVSIGAGVPAAVPA